MQLRWIAWGTALGSAPFAIGYALPWALGIEPSLPMEFSAIPLGLMPLAYASAIVRYRLLDIEVIVKRGLVYAAALCRDGGDLRRCFWRPWTGSSERDSTPTMDDRVSGDARGRAADAAGEEVRAERARPRVLSRSLRLPPRAVGSRAI